MPRMDAYRLAPTQCEPLRPLRPGRGYEPQDARCLGGAKSWETARRPRALRHCSWLTSFIEGSYIERYPPASNTSAVNEMAKTPRSKPKAEVLVADGSGGMRKMEDRRFERGDWPISFEVPVEQEQADRWSRYLRWSCHTRSWQLAGLGQIDRPENSGTMSISSSAGPQIDLTWERKRDRPLKVRARPVASATLTLASAEEFFREVNDRCQSSHAVPLYLRGTLQYDGLPWLGELWLDTETRLAPPSRQDQTASLGPRFIHVDATRPCIGEPDVPFVRHQMLTEMSAFLSVALRRAVLLPTNGRVWVVTADLNSSEVRYLGYLEPENPLSMPSPGETRSVPLYPPDQPPRGIGPNDHELSVRADVADLWALFCSLSSAKRLQFLQSAAKWQEAMIHWQDRPSLSFALMAVSCEALKPPAADKRPNCYDVVEALLGRDILDQIRQNWFPAQHVRSTHLHSGEFHGSELMMMDFMRTYNDPSFREAHSEMARITPAAIVEWLRRKGEFEFAKEDKPQRSIRRLVRENAVIACGACFLMGLLAGWAGNAFVTQ
jgi:hypothetical protein